MTQSPLPRLLVAATCAALTASCSSPGPRVGADSREGPWLPVRTLPSDLVPSPALAPSIVPHAVGTNVNVSNRPSITNSKGVTMNWPQSETDLAIDPTNGQHLLGGSNDLAGNMAVYESNDGGQTWVAGTMPNGITSCPSGDQCFESDPAVTFDKIGNAYFAQIAVDYPSSGQPSTSIYVSTKAKGSSSWATPVQMTNAINPDKEFMTADPATGRVFVAWDDNFFGQSAQIAYSDDQGSTWTQSSSTLSGSDSTTIGNYPLVGPTAMYDLYADWGNSRIRMSKSTDDGQTWGSPTTVKTWTLPTGGTSLDVVIPADPYRGVSAFPMSAIDMSSGTHRGRIYVAYVNKGSGSSCSATFTTANTSGTVSQTTINFETDVVLTHLDPGGSWSTPVRISDDTAGSCNDQFMPRAAVDNSDGTLYIAYYSTENDPNRTQADFYLARSTDGGLTFTYQKVTDQPSNEGRTLCHTSSTGPNTSCSDFNGYGDYSGLAAGNGAAHPFWTDSRLSTGDEETYTATVTPGTNPLPPSITTTALPGATVGTAYSTTVAASGGTTPYTWSATGLPASLSLNASTGAITGTPVAGDVGSHSVAFTVTDSAAQSASKTLTLAVTGTASGPTVTTTSLPAATAGTAYSTTLAATGGTTPYSWSVSGLPSTLSVNASTGAITGTPGSADVGAYTLAVTVTDAAAATGTASLSLTVNPGSGGTLALSPQTLTNAQEGVPYSVQLAATGGKTPYTFTWSTGFAPPSGLTIAGSTGVISGTPAVGTAGTVTLQVTVTDSVFATAARGYDLTIDPAGSGSSPVANAGPDRTLDPGSVQLDGSASSDPLGRALTYAWTAPANVTLSSTTDVKPSATLTKAGDYVFELAVTAGGVTSAPDSVKISINNVPPVADAGPAQTVKAGDKVTLDGSKSHDANGDTLTYSWKQIFGTTVALSSATAVKPSFTAGSDGAGYAFELTVTDPGNQSSKAVVTINETQAPAPGPKGSGGCGCGGGEGSVLALAGLIAAAWRKRRAA